MRLPSVEWLSRGANIESRNPALDGVRGVAILLVVVSHSNVPILKYGGAVGVTLFFVLSGYLITTLLLRERARTGRVHLGHFYARRALRLLPALVAALAGGVALAVAVGQDLGDTLKAAAACLFYVANLWPAIGLDLEPFGQLWSLAMEEQYYLLWPLALLGLARLKPRTALTLIAVAATLSLVLRFSYPVDTLHGYEMAYYMPHTSVWAILAGSGLAVLLASRPMTPSRGLVVIAAIGLALAASVLGLHGGLREPAGATSGYFRLAAGPVGALCALILVAHAAATPHARRLSAAWLVFFGWISYALYLWHGIIDHSMGTVFGSAGVRGLAVGAVSAVMAVGMAVLSARYVEAPFIARKNRLERGWHTPTDVDAEVTHREAEGPTVTR